MKKLAVTFCILHSALCILQAQVKTRVQDALFLADGSKATGSLNIAWPAFVSADGFTVARSSFNVKIVSGNVVVDLIPTAGATPAGISYTVTYSLGNSPSYTEFWLIPATGPVTIGQVRVSPMPTPTTTFGEQQLTLGTGLQTLLGLWKRNSSPVPTGEGQCYWDGLAHAVMCTDANLSFQPLAGGGGSTPDATASTKGKLKLSGDLGGTADAPTVPNAVKLTGDQSIAGQKTFTGTTRVQNLNAVRYVDQFTGANAGAKTAAAMADCPSTGCTVDARGLEGAHVISSEIFSAMVKPVTLDLGAATWSVSVDLTVPANVTLKFNQGACLSPDSGKTLRVSGAIENPGNGRIFCGAGAVVIDSSAVERVLPQWFGADPVGDGTSDDAVYIRKALATTRDTYLPRRTNPYLLKTFDPRLWEVGHSFVAYLETDGQRLYGDPGGTSLLVGNGALITAPGANGGSVFLVPINIDRTVIQDLSIDMNGPNNLVPGATETWQGTHVYSSGIKVWPTAIPWNRFIYEATTAGTSSGTEPVWPITVGATVADGSVVWTCRTVPYYPTWTVRMHLGTGNAVRNVTVKDNPGRTVIGSTGPYTALSNITIHNGGTTVPGNHNLDDFSAIYVTGNYTILHDAYPTYVIANGGVEMHGSYQSLRGKNVMHKVAPAVFLGHDTPSSQIGQEVSGLDVRDGYGGLVFFQAPMVDVGDLKGYRIHHNKFQLTTAGSFGTGEPTAISQPRTNGGNFTGQLPRLMDSEITDNEMSQGTVFMDISAVDNVLVARNRIRNVTVPIRIKGHPQGVKRLTIEGNEFVDSGSGAAGMAAAVKMDLTGSASVPSKAAFDLDTVSVRNNTVTQSSDQPTFTAFHLDGNASTKLVIGASNASPIVMQVAAHAYPNGQRVRVAGVTGNTAANGDWLITVVDADHFSLNGSTGNGMYIGAGTTQALSQFIDLDIGLNRITRVGSVITGTPEAAGYDRTGYVALTGDDTIAGKKSFSYPGSVSFLAHVLQWYVDPPSPFEFKAKDTGGLATVVGLNESTSAEAYGTFGVYGASSTRGGVGSLSGGIAGDAYNEGATNAEIQGITGYIENRSGTTANATVLYLNSIGIGEGSITNAYGIQVADITTGTNNWAIKTGLGSLQFGTLAGSGTRFVKAGASGLLSAATIANADLPTPTGSALGGVQAKTCTGTDKLSAVGTDGIAVCTADQGGGGAAWGGITGTLSSQTDLQSALDARFVRATANTLTNASAPSTPSAGFTSVWTDTTDKTLKAKDDAGVVTTTVKPTTCTGTDKVSAIGAGGVPVCSADQTGGGGGTWGSITGTLSSQTDLQAALDGKAALVTSGTAGVGPAYVGDASTAARSNHDHRAFDSVTWHFSGTPTSGVQNLTLVLPEGIVNPTITDIRATVDTTSASSSTVNIQRCTASCTGTSPTFANIYASNLTLSANTRTASKGSAPDQNVSGLAGGDQFKANLVTIGASLADITITMTYKVNTTN